MFRLFLVPIFENFNFLLILSQLVKNNLMKTWHIESSFSVKESREIMISEFFRKNKNIYHPGAQRKEHEKSSTGCLFENGSLFGR